MREDEPLVADGLSFERERFEGRAAATRSAWKTALRVVVVLLGSTLCVVMVSQVFLLLAEARGRHAAPAFPHGIFLRVDTGDPIVDSFGSRYMSCIPHLPEGGEEIREDRARQSINDRCVVMRHLVHGEDRKVIDLARAWARKPKQEYDDDPIEWLSKRVLVPGLSDAAVRADWASCKRYSLLTFELLDVLDPSPYAWYEELNRSLLLATLCDDAGTALAHSELARFIGSQIAAGRHLQETALERLQNAKNNKFARQWAVLLSSIRLLRGGSLEEAERMLRNTDAEASSALGDLLRLQRGRAVYWAFELERERLGNLAHARRQSALEQLDQLSSRMKRANLKSDLADYRDRLDTDAGR